MANDRPNIILVITDQQRYDTIAALGFSYMDTPHMDRLVQEGVSFSNCFVAAPTCVPSRAALFSGCHPHTTGIFRNKDRWENSWVQLLAASGYHCVNIGKMHTYPFETPLGFDERYVVENKDRYLEGRYFFDRWDMFLQAQGLVKQQRELYRQRPDYKSALGAFTWDLPKHTHSDTFVGGLACWWLDNKPLEKPLFMEIGFPGPHPPYDPLPEYVAPYLKKDLPLPQDVEADLQEQPQVLQAINRHHCQVDHDSVVWQYNPGQTELQRLRAHYAANVTMIDGWIGQIMTALEQRGELENTVLIFTSDHGDCLGDHGHIQKWNMYDQTVRVPLIVWGPNYVSAGRRCEQLVQNIDLAPAILELAQVAVPAYWEAKSIGPALRGEDFSGRRRVFCEQAQDATLVGITDQMTMVRDRRWKLVHYLGSHEGQLFDLESDPQERKNLWDEQGMQRTKQELLQAILEWRLRSSIQTGELLASIR